jgi:HPt (histidine-containing phosphotransfer) domain-containing protein
VLQHLSAIQGLDISSGLNSVRGNQASYLRLLGMLVEHHQADGQHVSECLAAGDLAQAGRLAHTLKGAAGSLGAVCVRDLADTLNTAIRQGASLEEINAHSNTLVIELASLMKAIKAAIASLSI